MTLFDTHCHLNHDTYREDFDATLQRATDADVRRMLVVGADHEGSRRAVSLALAHGGLWAAVGIHPEEAAQWDDARDELVALAQEHRDRVVAWGEIGLDYHWESIPRTEQERVFREQIRIAKSLDLPVVIHCREAFADTLRVLDDEQADRVLMHCFTGSTAEAQECIARNYVLGIGGVVTFKKSEALRTTVRSLPLERILLETDSPYLAPQKWRGKRNEPSYITEVARVIAEARGMTIKNIASATTASAMRFFRIPEPAS